jgi:hypothetical protein
VGADHGVVAEPLEELPVLTVLEGTAAAESEEEAEASEPEEVVSLPVEVVSVSVSVAATSVSAATAVEAGEEAPPAQTLGPGIT